MPKARGSNRQLTYIKEVTPGTTPAITPGDMKLIRGVNSTFNLERDSFQSNELRSDRGIHDIKMGNKQTKGNLDIELSYDNFDDFMKAVLCSADDFADPADVIKNGTTLQSFTIEEYYSSITFAQRYLGMYVNTLTLNLASNSQVTGSLEFMGLDQEISTTPLDSAPTDPTQGGLFDTYNGLLKEGGATIGYVSSMDVTITNGLSPTYVLFDDAVNDMIDGRCNITGSVTVYFENSTIYNKFVNETESALEFTLYSDVAKTKGYTFLLPRVKYTTGDKPVSGEGAIMLTMSFQALQDEVQDCTIKITKI